MRIGIYGIKKQFWLACLPPACKMTHRTFLIIAEVHLHITLYKIVKGGAN